MMQSTRPYHISVLVDEVLFYLAPQPYKIYVDVTFGGGGHTRAILQAEPTCRVIAIDWDQEAFLMHEQQFKDEFGDRITFIWGNFAQLALLLRKSPFVPSDFVREIGLPDRSLVRRRVSREGEIDGILADFGTSQHQIFSDRGFSFSVDSPLDMRMSPAHQKITAAHILNKTAEQDLVRIFKDYGQELHARAIARAVIAYRIQHLFKTTRQLAELIEQQVPRHGSRIHPATKVFQALRIAVNHELESIAHFLRQSTQVLADGGRLVCISFHSLEDRLVKQFMHEHKKRPGVPGFELLTDGVVQATQEELAQNPAARSAKLRAAQWSK